MKKMFNKILDVVVKPEMMILPGSLAFYIILAIFPLLTILGYLGTNIASLSTYITSMINNCVPKEIGDILISFISNEKISGNVIFFLIGGFYLASNGAASIVVTSNQLYDINHASPIKRRIKAFIMIMLLIIILVFMALILAYGNLIVKKIITLPPFHGISNLIYFFFLLLKWPISFVCIFLVIKFIYTFAPDEFISSKYMNKGALFTTLGWIATTYIYSIYVSHFAHYTVFYGSISAIIAMMMWIYFLSYILVFGIVINVLDYEKIK